MSQITAMSLLKILEGKTIQEVKGVDLDAEEVPSAYAGNVEIYCSDGTVVELEGEPYNYGDTAGIRVKVAGKDSLFRD